MIYEFALDPAVVATWGRKTEFAYFVKEFGLGTPRVMSAYPGFKQWKRDVNQKANNLEKKPLDKTRLADMLKVLSNKRLARTDSQYSMGKSWVRNATDEHTRRPFHAILASEIPDDSEQIIRGVLDEVLSHKYWQCLSSKSCNRTSEEIVEAVQSLLHVCKRVLFIDPHFGLERPGYRATFEKFINALVTDRPSLPSQIEIHCLAKAEYSFFVEKCDEWMSKWVPRNLRVRFFRWKQKQDGERLHDRFILTDLGGVEVSGGLDAGKVGETTNIFLLSRDQYEMRWRQYTQSPPAFDLIDQHEPVGTRELRNG